MKSRYAEQYDGGVERLDGLSGEGYRGSEVWLEGVGQARACL